MRSYWFSKSGRLVLSLSVLVLLVAVACGTAAAPEQNGDGGQAPTAAMSSTAAPTSEAMPTEAPAMTEPSGSLRIGYTYIGNDGLYPKMNNINAGGKDIQTTMYDWIIGSDGQGAFSTETGLADEWSTSADAMHHTVHLRDGVKFHDGADVTAHDAMFSIEKVMEEDSQSSFIRELTPMLESLETPDDHTLVINCNEPCLFGLWIFSGVRGVDGDVIEKAYYEDKGEAYFAQHPIGSGPYRFQNQVLGTSVTVESIDEPHFRGGGVKPKFKTIEFQGIPEETTRIANLKAGDVDIIDTSRERVDSLKKDGFNIFYKERADLMGAYFFQQWEPDSPFKDLPVRQALNLAINRQVILDHIFSGQGGMAFYPFGSYGFNSGVNPDLLTYPYDPDKSVELLKGQGFSESNPLEVKMAIYPFGGISEFTRMIEAIAADFENTGLIKVQLQPTEYGTLRDQRRAKQLPGWIGPWATTNRAAPAEIISITRALFDSRAPNTTYGNPDFDPILDEAFGALDESEVPGIISRLHQFLYDDNAVMPLFEVDTPFATSDKITSWDLGRDSYDKNLDSLIFPNFVPTQ